MQVKVGDMVESLVSQFGVCKGKEYKVVSVNHNIHGEVTSVDVLDDEGDDWPLMVNFMGVQEFRVPEL